jgi:hypothetical protein
MDHVFACRWKLSLIACILLERLGGFGFYDLEQDKSHYNITLMILIRKKVLSRNRKSPFLLTGTRAFK